MKNRILLILLVSFFANEAHAQRAIKAPVVENVSFYRQPQPPYDMYNYLHQHINYPEPAREGGVQGKVKVQFMVDKKGNITRVKVIRGIGSGCDEEAKRVISSMPPWIPANCNGKAVPSVQMIPVSFKLE